MLKKTKIICSIGPSTQSWENFKGIVEAGMNVARINFSHATLEERAIDEALVKRANEELNANIAILYDTKGPDLRTCAFVDDKIELVKGNIIRIIETNDENFLGTKDAICFNYKGILKDLKVGSVILVDDGFYKLIVISVESDGVTCRIENSGVIKSRRGVCIPGIKLNVPYVSKQDEEDIKYACEHDGDYLALSFVNTKEDIYEVKELCKKFGKPNMIIISKVETQYAIDNLEEIVEASDYIMVARGDLGIETGVENLPLYQKKMIDMCHANGKGVIMATQMMYSMKTNIRPTNAEVTDVANAVIAGCDAIMTSDETTIGKYPVETISTMTKICLNVEKVTKYHLEDYKLLGFIPESIDNFLALLGWSSNDNKEILSMQEMIKNFDIKNISKSPTFFDFKKLLWIGNEYFKKMDNDKYINFVSSYIEDKNLNSWLKSNIQSIILLFKNQISYASQLNDLIKEHFIDSHVLNDDDITIVKNNMDVILLFKDLIQSISSFNEEKIIDIINDVKVKTGKKGKDLFMPIRLCSTNMSHGPELAKMIYFTGHKKVIENIENLLKKENSYE